MSPKGSNGLRPRSLTTEGALVRKAPLAAVIAAIDCACLAVNVALCCFARVTPPKKERATKQWSCAIFLLLALALDCHHKVAIGTARPIGVLSLLLLCGCSAGERNCDCDRDLSHGVVRRSRSAMSPWARLVSVILVRRDSGWHCSGVLLSVRLVIN